MSAVTKRSGRRIVRSTSRWRYSLMQLAATTRLKERAMKGYVDDIEQATIANEDFRRVLYTGQATSSWC